MYYMKKYEEQTVHIHVKSDGVYIKNRQGTMLSVLDEPRTIRQTEQLFNAKFRFTTNNDGSKTKLFM
jgi:hypothetical protein